MLNETYGIVKTFKLTAKEYIGKHDPTYTGINPIGNWYEHPIYGDEIGLLVVLRGTNQIHQTIWEDVPQQDINGDLY